jgi:hypothetical protein
VRVTPATFYWGPVDSILTPAGVVVGAVWVAGAMAVPRGDADDDVGDRVVRCG